MAHEHKLKIGKKYSVNGGARFARVECTECGRSVDVKVRGSKQAGPDDWGDTLGEETRASFIKAKALEKMGA